VLNTMVEEKDIRLYNTLTVFGSLISLFQSLGFTYFPTLSAGFTPGTPIDTTCNTTINTSEHTESENPSPPHAATHRIQPYSIPNVQGKIQNYLVKTIRKNSKRIPRLNRTTFSVFSNKDQARNELEQTSFFSFTRT
jgi:hypothetical protein